MLFEKQGISKPKASKLIIRLHDPHSQQFSKIKEKKLIVLKQSVNYETGLFCSREPPNAEVVKLLIPYLNSLEYFLDVS